MGDKSDYQRLASGEEEALAVEGLGTASSGCLGSLPQVRRPGTLAVPGQRVSVGWALGEGLLGWDQVECLLRLCFPFQEALTLLRGSPHVPGQQPLLESRVVPVWGLCMLHELG